MDQDMTVFASTQRELERIANASPDLASSPLAAMALALGAEIDGDTSATSKSMCARALSDVLQQLRDLTPEEAKGDGIDEIAARRAQRLGGRAAPKAS